MKKEDYKISYACLNCRIAFKRSARMKGQQFPLLLTCTICSGDALNFGRHFKAPPCSDLKQWKKVKFLAQHGFWFQRIHLSSSWADVAPYRDTLEQAKEFVEKYRDYAIKIDDEIIGRL